MSFDDRRSLREPTSDVCEGLRSCSRDLFHPDGLCRVSTKELLRLPCAVVVLDSVHATLAVDSIGRVRLQCMALATVHGTGTPGEYSLSYMANTGMCRWTEYGLRPLIPKHGI